MYVNEHGSGVNWITVDETDPQDELFDLLRHPARRRILSELVQSDSGDVLSLDDIDPERTLSERDHICLDHTHLPKLAAAGYVEWNRRTDTVVPGPRFETIEPAIQLFTDNDKRLPGEWP